MGICQTKDKGQGVTDQSGVTEPQRKPVVEAGAEAPVAPEEGADRQLIEEQKVSRDGYIGDESDNPTEEAFQGDDVAVENPEERSPDMKQSLVKQPLRVPVSEMKTDRQEAPAPAQQDMAEGVAVGEVAAGAAVGALGAEAIEQVVRAPGEDEQQEASAEVAPPVEEQKEILIEEWTINPSNYIEELDKDWDKMHELAKNKRSIPKPFDKLRYNKFTDKNIKKDQTIINKDKQEKYFGSMLQNKKHGVGSLVKDQGRIQTEGIWIDDNLMGKSYLLQINDEGHIFSAIEQLNGEIVKTLPIDQRTRSESHKLVQSGEQISERKGSDTQAKPAGAGTGGHESESVEGAGTASKPAPGASVNPEEGQPQPVKI